MLQTDSPGLKWADVRTWLLVSDGLAVAVALVIAYWLRFGLGAFETLAQVPPAPIWLVPALWVTWMVLFGFAGLYTRRHTVSGIGEYRRVLTATIWTLIIVVLAAYLRTHPYISRGYLVLSAVLIVIAVALGRFAVRRVIYRMAANGRCLDRVLIVGTDQQAISLARQLASSPTASCQVIGFLSDYLPTGARVSNAGNVLGEPLELSAVAQRHGVTRAFVVEAGLSWESLRGVVKEMHRARSLEISLVPGLFDLHSTSMVPYQIGPVLTLAPRAARIVGIDAALKRALDLVVASIVLVFALPVFAVLVAVAAINGEGTGTVTERYVDGGGEFTLRRFTSPQWAVDLHLARLINLPLVLRGRMSLLGPRPIAAHRAGDYGEARTLLESAKPGFIGPWWLAGIERPPEFKEELAYDLFYLRNYSIWFDLHMLLQAARGLRGSAITVRGYTPDLVAHSQPDVSG